MAIPKTGDVSLLAVRDDVGVTGPFSMNSREAIDKLNWDSSKRSLTQYRGNVLGNQYLAGEATLSTYQKATRRTSYRGSEIGEPSDADSQKTWPDEPRHTQYYRLESRPVSTGDCWSENRHHGVLVGGGDVIVEAYVKAQGDGTFHQMKISLVASMDGFLEGPQTVVLDFYMINGAYKRYRSNVMTVPSSHPYLSMIVYGIAKAGASTTGRLHEYAGPRVYLV